MRSIVRDKFASEEVLKLEEIEKPVLTDGGLPIFVAMDFSKSLDKTKNLERECREGTNFANFSELIRANSVIRPIRVEKTRL